MDVLPRIAFANLAPALFLTFVMLLGGGTLGGMFANVVVQLVALAILLWALFFPGKRERTNAERSLDYLALAYLGWLILCLLPLPPGLWSALPGREGVVRGFTLLGAPLPWLPLSTSPADSLWSGLSLLPLIAMALLVRRAGAEANRILIVAILGVAAANAVLGIGQYVTGIGSRLYLFDVTNRGFAVGFFANANHLATLMAAAAVLAAYYFSTSSSDARRARTSTRRAKLAKLAGFDALLFVATLFTESNAGLILFAAALGATPFLMGAFTLKRWIFWGGAAGASIAIAGAFALAVSQPGVLGAGSDQHGTSRAQIYPRAAQLMRDNLPFGTGLGSFARAYPAYEDANRVTQTYANHAHSDLVEWLVELGVAGAIFLILLLLWAVRHIGASLDFSTRHARAAQAAFGALLLIGLHSLIDYPVRTAAMATMVAALLALIARDDWERE